MKALIRAPAVQLALGFLLSSYIAFALATMRWRFENRAPADAAVASPQGLIGCFWHSRISISPACWPLDRAQEPRAMISLSADGEFIAKAMERVGFPAIRGSASKNNDRAKGLYARLARAQNLEPTAEAAE